MAQVFHGGSRASRALIYGEKSSQVLDVLERNLERFREDVGEVGRHFYERAADVYERFNGSAALRYARMVRNQVRGLFRPDTIRTFTDIGDMQQAGPVGRRWLMASEFAYERFQQQRISAWEGTWVDPEPGVPARERRDWRMVNHGLVHDVEDNEDYGWKVTFHFDDLEPGEKPLTIDQKDTILDNQARFEAFVLLGEEDPSSKHGDSL